MTEVIKRSDMLLDPYWTPSCHLCCAPFPGSGLPPESEWICRSCLYDYETWRQRGSDDTPELELRVLAAQRERHVKRFGAVSRRYPRRVAAAYGGDLESAARSTDDQVAAKVRAYELKHWLEPCDWRAIGAEERSEVGA